ncbi:MAG: cytochrome-c oxidase, cbb3-type subunit III [Chromatiales bacterium]|jgi:cytochrome c oxidase cbb3-type subunit 3|nr:cytochrome-c oxidase, cbb3-type subunit III [Chromatiales bacterium]
MSSFWSWYIIILTVGSIIASVWLMSSNSKGSPGEVDTTGHKWDGDLQEYNNPLPRWWLYLFYVTVVFSVAYLILYPGLGSFAGTSKWSQVDQYNAQMSEAEAKYADFYARFRDMEIQAIAGDQAAMRAAGNIFGNNCAQCHGSDGRGAVGFPNLTDDNWQWGGSEDAILATLRNGRNGIMPAQAAVLGSDEAVEEVVAYVRSMSGLEAPADKAKAGQQRFAMVCAACHGPDGKGNPMLGAPNLTDDTWLYGSSPGDIRYTIANGRANQMPAQLDYLGEDRLRLMAAYVMSLSETAGD